MSACARWRPTITCGSRSSGLLTECPSSPTTATIQPAVDTVLDAFDIDRLIWGSDWPVALMAAPYEDTFERVTAALGGLSPERTRGPAGRKRHRLLRA